MIEDKLEEIDLEKTWFEEFTEPYPMSIFSLLGVWAIDKFIFDIDPYLSQIL